MNKPIDFTPNGNINLNLLKSEIDRKISVIFALLNHVLLFPSRNNKRVSIRTQPKILLPSKRTILSMSAVWIQHLLKKTIPI